MRKSLAVLKNQPRILWITVLGATLFVPLLFTVVLSLFSLEVREGFAISAWPRLALTVLFAIAFFLATTYFHALLLAAAKDAHKKTGFSFLQTFAKARPLYLRTLALNASTGLPALVLVGASLLVHGTLSYILGLVAGIYLVICAYLGLRVGKYLPTHSFSKAVKRSVREVFSKKHLISWSWVKLSGSIVTLAFFLFGYAVIADAQLAVQAGFILTHFFMVLGSVVAPQILFVSVLFFGGAGIVHFSVLLLLHLLFVLLATLIAAE